MGILVGGGGFDGDLHEFGGAFAVSDDKLSEALGKGGQNLLHGSVVW